MLIPLDLSSQNHNFNQDLLRVISEISLSLRLRPLHHLPFSQHQDKSHWSWAPDNTSVHWTIHFVSSAPLL